MIITLVVLGLLAAPVLITNQMRSISRIQKGERAPWDKRTKRQR